LYFDNHGRYLYSGWSNTSEYAVTRESFLFIPLQSDVLTDAVNKIPDSQLSNMCAKPLTVDQKFCSAQTGTKLPFLPVATLEERKLYTSMMISVPNAVPSKQFFTNLSLQWLANVDGVSVFPKLPTHFSRYHKSWSKNRKIKDSSIKYAKELQSLKSFIDSIPEEIEHAPIEYEHQETVTGPAPRTSNQLANVGGIRMTPNLIWPGHQPAQTRGADKRPRQKRKCMLCVNAGRQLNICTTCPGRTGRGTCMFADL